MIVFPLIATGVSIAFSAALVLQYKQKRGLPQLAWGIAMAAFSIASIAVAAGTSGGWDPTLYRVFWLFGALLNVPWLAVGSIALVSPRAIGIAAFGLAVLGSAFAVVSVARAEPSMAGLAVSGIPSGREVWGDAQSAMVNFYSIVPYFIVVGIAVLSSLRRKGVRPPKSRVQGNYAIAAGATIVAVGGFALRRLDDSGIAFSTALALGVVVMYAGFLLASRAPRYRVEEPGESPT